MAAWHLRPGLIEIMIFLKKSKKICFFDLNRIFLIFMIFLFTVLRVSTKQVVIFYDN